MSEFDITAQIGDVNFSPGSTVEEILQNVRTILTTPIYSVPLDRSFGVAITMLDSPLPVAQAKLSAEIIAAINKWEPRAKVTSVTYDKTTSADAQEGILRPKVRVRIVE